MPHFVSLHITEQYRVFQVSNINRFSCLQVPWLEQENNDYSSMERSSSRGGAEEDEGDVVAMTDLDEFGTQRTTSLLTSYSRHAVQQSATNPNVVFRRPVDLMY